MSTISNEAGHMLGLHRVLDSKKCLPQAAEKLDASLPIRSNEALVRVQALQIDSASFAQLRSVHADEAALGNSVREIVANRGKMQNPVTGSGGMLLGEILVVGSQYPDKSLKVGDKIATLVSLTATPLAIEKIISVDLKRERVLIEGHAIMSANFLYAKMPADISEGTALAGFDICGAPILAKRHVKAGDTVFVIGLGKAGRSCVASLSQEYGDKIKLYGIDPSADAVAFCSQYFPGTYAVVDARDPLAVADWIEKQTAGVLADFTINTANVSDTEMSAVLATHDGGGVLYFGMATSFQKAALGCESVGRDIALFIGTGYSKGHADDMMNLLRSCKPLREYFEKFA